MQQREQQSAKVLAVLNQKGGAGKTTTAVNLGAAMANLGRRVLVVDVDPQAHATVHLGVRPHAAPHTLYDLITNADLPAEDAVRLIRERLFLLPSNLRLSAAERDLLHRFGREQILQMRLLPLRNQFDYIVLDCPPSLGLLSVNALCASDELVVPVPADYFALEGLVQLLETLDLLRTHLGRQIQVMGILITRFDSRRTLARETREAAKKYNLPVFETVIRENVRLAEAPSHGCDIFSYDASASGAEDYLKFTKEYLHEHR